MATTEALVSARRRTWRQDPEGRRARVIKEATREFAENGFHGARLDRIARAAGVSESLVYAQFESKRGLLEALGSDYGKALADATFGIEHSFGPEDVATMVDSMFMFVSQTEESLVAYMLATDPTEGGIALDANRGQMLNAIKQNLDRWVSEKLIPPINTQITAEIQFALVESAIRECFLRREGKEEKAYRHEVARVLRASMMVV